MGVFRSLIRSFNFSIAFLDHLWSALWIGPCSGFPGCFCKSYPFHVLFFAKPFWLYKWLDLSIVTLHHGDPLLHSEFTFISEDITGEVICSFGGCFIPVPVIICMWTVNFINL